MDYTRMAGDTAICRKVNASVAYRYATAYYDIDSTWIDWGCGKGEEADTHGLTKYDPNHYPVKVSGKFAGAINSCVINTIPLEYQKKMLRELRSHLKKGAPLIISYRPDVAQQASKSKTATPHFQGWLFKRGKMKNTYQEQITPAHLTTLLTNAGFTSIRVVRSGLVEATAA